ncbi:MAG: LPS export ABC transporter periplasmic protein LptC [Pseudomonadota bacterium]
MDRHSRVVAFLKVVLPLMALGLLSTLFLLSQDGGGEAAIPYSDTEIAERLRDQQMTGPFFTGTTANGDRIALTAEKMTLVPGLNRAEGLRADMDLAGGGRVTLNADRAEVDIGAGDAELTGNVQITGARGLTVSSELLQANLTEATLRSPGPVDAVGDFGTLEAGQMMLTSGGSGDTAQLVFTSGVKLIYQPGNPAEGRDP